MNFRRPNKKHPARQGFLIAFLALLVFVFDYTTHGIVQRTLQHAAAPVLALGTDILVAVPSLSSYASLEEENEALRGEVARLGHVELENAHLRDALSDLQAIAIVGIPFVERTYVAPITSRVAIPLYGTFTIDTHDTPTLAGARVYGENQILVGTVGTLLDNSFAQVQLISTFGRTTEAVVKDEAGKTIAISLVGRGNGNFIAQVPRDAKIAIGTSVYALEFGIEPIGVVGDHDQDPRDSVQTVRIRVPFVIDAQRFVRVEKTP